jgi:hypothetical protein
VAASDSAAAFVTVSKLGVDILTGAIFYFGNGQFVFHGVSEFDISDSVRRLLDLPVTPSLPLPPKPTGKLGDVPRRPFPSIQD